METLQGLEKKIEHIRQKMYEAYNNSEEYCEVVRISQELDDLLNQLDHLTKNKGNH